MIATPNPFTVAGCAASLATIVGMTFVLHAVVPEVEKSTLWIQTGWVALGSVAVIAASVGIGALFSARNMRALRGHRISWFELGARATLLRYQRAVQYRGLRRPLVGHAKLTDSIPLSAVRFASWFISPIQVAGEREDVVQPWDRDPELQLEVFGPTATNEAVLLGNLALGELAGSPVARQATLAYLSEKAARGEFNANVDLDSGEPIIEALPPLASGTSFLGDAVVQAPTDGTRA